MKGNRLNNLKKFLSGDCTDVEAQEIINWIHSNQFEKSLENDLLSSQGKNIPDDLSYKTLNKIISLIQEQELAEKIESSMQGRGHEVLMQKQMPKNRKVFKLIKIAASISVIIITFLAGYFMKEKEKVVKHTDLHQMIEKKTSAGQKLTFHLSDGTVVKLNSGSKLTFPEQFVGENSRAVHLDGEAFFEVTENPEKPFIVSTQNLITTALGTSFTVRDNNDSQEVFLLSGKVNVVINRQRDNNQILNSGEKAQYDKATNQLSKGTFNEELETGWKDGLLVFDKTPFKDLVKKIESWYGVKVNISGNPPTDLYASSKFQNDYLKEVMLSLAYSLKFEFEIQEDNNVVLIKF